MEDHRNFFEVLLPKLKAASEKFDMIPCPQKRPFDPQPWQSDDNCLPGKPEPYFLKNSTGPAYQVGGMVCRPLVTTAESRGKFTIGCFEGSSHHHDASLFADAGVRLRFKEVHHAFQVVDGSVRFEFDSSEVTTLSAGELVYVPKGTAFRFEVRSRFARMYTFANGGGLVELVRELGTDYSSPIPPENAEKSDGDALAGLQARFGFVIG